MGTEQRWAWFHFHCQWLWAECEFHCNDSCLKSSRDFHVGFQWCSIGCFFSGWWVRRQDEGEGGQHRKKTPVICGKSLCEIALLERAFAYLCCISKRMNIQYCGVYSISLTLLNSFVYLTKVILYYSNWPGYIKDLTLIRGKWKVSRLKLWMMELQ